jgi:hypothetical protein
VPIDSGVAFPRCRQPRAAAVFSGHDVELILRCTRTQQACGIRSSNGGDLRRGNSAAFRQSIPLDFPGWEGAERRLHHHESANRVTDDNPETIARLKHEADDIKRVWGKALMSAPYDNSNLSDDIGECFDLAFSPRHSKSWRQ